MEAAVPNRYVSHHRHGIDEVVLRTCYDTYTDATRRPPWPSAKIALPIIHIAALPIRPNFFSQPSLFCVLLMETTLLSDWLCSVAMNHGEDILQCLQVVVLLFTFLLTTLTYSFHLGADVHVPPCGPYKKRQLHCNVKNRQLLLF